MVMSFWRFENSGTSAFELNLFWKTIQEALCSKTESLFFVACQTCDCSFRDQPERVVRQRRNPQFCETTKTSFSMNNLVENQTGRERRFDCKRQVVCGALEWGQHWTPEDKKNAFTVLRKTISNWNFYAQSICQVCKSSKTTFRAPFFVWPE